MKGNRRMDEQRVYDVREALTLLKGGYLLKLVFKDREYQVYFHKGKIHLKNETEGLCIQEYEFTSLYQDCRFYIDHSSMDEETVDMKKDEEYYSWRQ